MCFTLFSSNIWNGCVSTRVVLHIWCGATVTPNLFCVIFKKKRIKKEIPRFFFCLAAAVMPLWRGFLLLFVVYFYPRSYASFYFFFSMPDNCTMYNLVLVLRLGIMCLFCDSALVVVVFYPRSDSSSSIQCPMIVNNV